MELYTELEDNKSGDLNLEKYRIQKYWRNLNICNIYINKNKYVGLLNLKINKNKFQKDR